MPNHVDWYLILVQGKKSFSEIILIDGNVIIHCFRTLYWTNIRNSRPTIERSFLNGSQREILVETDLLLPNSLDLDVVEQRLYWAESLPNGYFHIVRSFVNGTGRQEIYRGMGQFVISLTVG